MIRMIEEKDIPICLQWYNHYILHSSATFETEPLTLPEFAERVSTVRQKYPWIILEEDGSAVGYAYLSCFIPRSAYDWSCDLAIYLDPDQRSKGYGKKLMAAILELACSCGYYSVVSIITEGNIPSEKLHEEAGFEKKGSFEKIGFKNGTWLGISWYVKKLRQAQNSPLPVKNTDEIEGEFNKMKIYGSPLCPDCVRFLSALDQNAIRYDFTDMTASMPNLKEFLKLRDHEPLFASVKEAGGVGIPAFMDGETLRIDWQEYLKERGIAIPEEPAAE